MFFAPRDGVSGSLRRGDPERMAVLGRPVPELGMEMASRAKTKSKKIGYFFYIFLFSPQLCYFFIKNF